MTVGQLEGYIKRHWDGIKESLLDGTYQPMPVRRKEIDKPDGGVRLLGIPTVLDRMVQQAVAQVLNHIWDHTFSENSFGFRPGRSQRQAIRRCQEYLADGYRYVVDIDLSKFFDRVNHDRLMSRLAIKIKDKRVLKLIRSFLTSGTMVGGLVEPGDEGTPQGGPLSPLLSNIVLDELDKELEKRGLKFVRYLYHPATPPGGQRRKDRHRSPVAKQVSRLQPDELSPEATDQHPLEIDQAPQRAGEGRSEAKMEHR